MPTALLASPHPQTACVPHRRCRCATAARRTRNHGTGRRAAVLAGGRTADQRPPARLGLFPERISAFARPTAPRSTPFTLWRLHVGGATTARPAKLSRRLLRRLRVGSRRPSGRGGLSCADQPDPRRARLARMSKILIGFEIGPLFSCQGPVVGGAWHGGRIHLRAN
jgi:hypothetical protein